MFIKYSCLHYSIYLWPVYWTGVLTKLKKNFLKALQQAEEQSRISTSILQLGSNTLPTIFFGSLNFSPDPNLSYKLTII